MNVVASNLESLVFINYNESGLHADFEKGLAGLLVKIVGE
jgi:hypothetical protein